MVSGRWISHTSRGGDGKSKGGTVRKASWIWSKSNRFSNSVRPNWNLNSCFKFWGSKSRGKQAGKMSFHAKQFDLAHAAVRFSKPLSDRLWWKQPSSRESMSSLIGTITVQNSIRRNYGGSLAESGWTIEKNRCGWNWSALKKDQKNSSTWHCVTMWWAKFFFSRPRNVLLRGPFLEAINSWW